MNVVTKLLSRSTSVSLTQSHCIRSIASPTACSACSTSASTNPDKIATALRPSEVSARMMVDTLAMMKTFEENGLSRGQSEALTRYITEVVLSICKYYDVRYISQEAMERLLIEVRAGQKEMAQELSVQQQVHMASVGKDTERLQTQLDKFKADIKHDVEKLTSNQKLDLNLERGRLRDELQQVRDRGLATNLNMEREINMLRTQIETAKSDTLKWVVVTVGGLLGAGLAAIRLSLAS